MAFNFAGRLGNPSHDPDHFGGNTDTGTFITRRIATRPRLMRCRSGGSEVGAFQRPPFIAAACLLPPLAGYRNGTKTASRASGSEIEDPNPTRSAKAGGGKASVRMCTRTPDKTMGSPLMARAPQCKQACYDSVGLVELLGNSMLRLVLLLIIAPNAVSWTRREK